MMIVMKTPMMIRIGRSQMESQSQRQEAMTLTFVHLVVIRYLHFRTFFFKHSYQFSKCCKGFFIYVELL